MSICCSFQGVSGVYILNNSMQLVQNMKAPEKAKGEKDQTKY